MAVSPSTLILGIDPGIINLGLAVCLLSETGSFSVTNVSTNKIGANTDDISTLSTNLLSFFQHVYATFSLSSYSRVIVGIERQKKHTNDNVLIVESILWGIITAANITCYAIDPATVKRLSGIGCNGHAENKKKAVELMRQLNIVVNADHEADAVITAMYGVLPKLGIDAKTLPRYQKKKKTEEKKRKDIGDY